MTDNFQSQYGDAEPARAEIDALDGTIALEFGAPWCPICQGAQPDIQAAVRKRPDIRHIKVEDGSGRPLGRSFRVKLWPTIIVLKNGTEIARVVRPTNQAAIEEALSKSA